MGPLLSLLSVLPVIILATAHLQEPEPVSDAPTVHLDGATFIGSINNTVSQFLGIPFAQSTYVFIVFLTLRPNKTYDAVRERTASIFQSLLHHIQEREVLQRSDQHVHNS